jgi:hypothetical protein
MDVIIPEQLDDKLIIIDEFEGRVLVIIRVVKSGLRKCQH